MAFAKKMMGVPLRIWSHSQTKPNCRQKDMRKSLSHFLQGKHGIGFRIHVHSLDLDWTWARCSMDVSVMLMLI